MFPFLQFVNPAGRDSCLLLRGFLAKKPAQVSATEFSLRAGPRAVQHPSPAAAGQRFAGCLSSKEAGSGPPTCRKGRPVLPQGGGEVRGPASILPGSAAGGAGCGQLPETLETLGGGAVLRDWEGGSRHRPLQLLTSAGTVQSRRGSSTSCEQVGSKGWLTKWDREKMEGNLTVRWRCAGFQSELWVEAAGGGIVLLLVG